MKKTPWTLGGRKNFNGEAYSFLANEDSLRRANALVKRQRKGGMRARIWQWKREDGKLLYSVWIRRRKDFWSNRYRKHH